MDWGLTLRGRREADAGAWDTLLVAKVRVRCVARGHFPGSCLVHQQTEGLPSSPCGWTLAQRRSAHDKGIT